MFVRQGPRSIYCAPYATAAFLGLIGQPLGRAEILRAFGARRANWPGAPRVEIARVARQACPGLRTSWLHLRASSGSDFFGRLAQVWDGRPLLTTANCLLLRHQVTDWHTFVIVAVADDAVRILDPLFRPPAEGHLDNMELRLFDGRAQTSNHSSRLAWGVDFDQPICLMRWSIDAPPGGSSPI